MAHAWAASKAGCTHLGEERAAHKQEKAGEEDSGESEGHNVDGQDLVVHAVHIPGAAGGPGRDSTNKKPQGNKRSIFFG